MNKHARFSGTPDSNEREIIQALQDRGAVVIVIDRPVDLVVGYLGTWVFAEVKASRKARIRKSQQSFLNRCAVQGLPCVLVYDLADVDQWWPVLADSGASDHV